MAKISSVSSVMEAYYKLTQSQLTQEELNALSPRARKAYEEKHGDEVISEILTENPNKFEIDEEEENEEL